MQTNAVRYIRDGNAHSTEFGLGASTAITANRILHQCSSEYVKGQIETLRETLWVMMSGAAVGQEQD